MPPKVESPAGLNSSFIQQTVYQSSHLAEFNPNLESWTVWKERLDIHFCEIGCTDKQVKKSIMLKSIGAVPYRVLHSLCSPETPVSKSFDELCDIMSFQYTPPTIVFTERKKFHVSTKLENESVAIWYARVKTLALNCKFGANLDAFVLNQFIMGLPSYIFERLCEEDEALTVQTALKKAMILETKKVSKLSHAEGNAVNFVSKQKFYKKHNGSGGSRSGRGNGSSSKDGRGNGRNQDSDRGEAEKKQTCSHCGWRNHSSAACKYKESKCHACGKIGHLASICQNKKRSVNFVSNDKTDSDDLFNFSIFSVAECKSSDVYSLPIVIDGVNINAVVDTGAPCTLLPI